MQGVFHAGLLLLHLGLGRGADIDDGDTAGELRETLLELLAIVVAGGFLDLAADLVHPALDVDLLAFAFDDRGVFLVDGDALGPAEVVERDVLELDAEVFGDATATGEDRDVFEHGLAAIAEAGSLDGGNLEGAAELVHHERRERFAFDVFRDDRGAACRSSRPSRAAEAVLQARDLLLVDEDVRVLEDGFHRLGVGHEVRGEVAFVELHAFDDVERGLDRLGFFDGDRAVLADLVHRVGDDFADRRVPVGGNGRDLSDLVAVLDLLGDFLSARRRWPRRPC